jgi:hypothetical protein
MEKTVSVAAIPVALEKQEARIKSGSDNVRLVEAGNE